MIFIIHVQLHILFTHISCTTKLRKTYKNNLQDYFDLPQEMKKREYDG